MSSQQIQLKKIKGKKEQMGLEAQGTVSGRKHSILEGT